MSIKLFDINSQAKGNFNGGEILENKPIGFPQDGGDLKPYSNLFYWAHAWAPNNDSIIGLHPHRGFEICSFVLKGEIEHYDTLLDKWITLNEGDVQVIKAGKGISHSEKLKSGSEIFQIWFDPNLHESLYIDASYNEYKSDEFNIESKNFISTKVISDSNNQIDLDSKGIEIYHHNIEKGDLKHKIQQNKCHSIFIQFGSIEINELKLNKGDFVIIEKEDEVKLKINSDSKVFEIISLTKPPYTTYAEMHNIN